MTFKCGERKRKHKCVKSVSAKMSSFCFYHISNIKVRMCLYCSQFPRRWEKSILSPFLWIGPLQIPLLVMSHRALETSPRLVTTFPARCCFHTLKALWFWLKNPESGCQQRLLNRLVFYIYFVWFAFEFGELIMQGFSSIHNEKEHLKMARHGTFKYITKTKEHLWRRL